MKYSSPYINLIGQNLIVNTIEYCHCKNCNASNGYDCWLSKFKPCGKSTEFISESDCLRPNCWSVCEIERLRCVDTVLEYFGDEEVLITDPSNIAGHTWRFVLKVKDNNWKDVEVVGLWVDCGSWLVGSFSYYDLAWCAKQETTDFVTWSVWRKLFQEGFIY